MRYPCDSKIAKLSSSNPVAVATRAPSASTGAMHPARHEHRPRGLVHIVILERALMPLAAPRQAVCRVGAFHFAFCRSRARRAAYSERQLRAGSAERGARARYSRIVCRTHERLLETPMLERLSTVAVSGVGYVRHSQIAYCRRSAGSTTRPWTYTCSFSASHRVFVGSRGDRKIQFIE